ncbi:MAG: hypothetical protein LW710_11060 [Burkholderiales bacterium]|jgi:hypothetical protein|uniref:hypothetical protein n=1 Tax=Limnobacter sp. TaxID=2003368 RepID=UPI0039BC6026|nr:hypothetical protein [Burkholderiales bacterium]
MLSNSNRPSAFAAPGRQLQFGAAAYLPQSNLARTTSNLWMALGDEGVVPDFNPGSLGRSPKAHPTLIGQISRLKLLPGWQSSLGKNNSKPHFTQVLGEARMLAQEMYSMWGDTDALSLLQLVGSSRVIKAYDRGDDFALSACAVAYTLIRADQAVRAQLGELVDDEMQLVDTLSKIQFLNYDDLVPSIANTKGVPSITPTTMVYNSEGLPVLLKVRLNHPDLKPAGLLTEVLRMYENVSALASLGVEDIANLLNEPLSGIHVITFFTLVDGPFHHVCNSIEPIPEPVFSSFEWSDCKHAFEQCCRYFGEDFMLQTTFGKHPSTTHDTLFKDRLMKILPVMQRFLNGDEASWS